jgi:hypothetical protein
MSEPEIHSDPFSAADEAFFQAGMQADHEAPSERPVTLEQDPVVEIPPREAEARRARFVRPVASMLVGLCALTLVGLVRYALRSDSSELEPRRPTVVHAVTTAQPLAGAQPARDLAPELADDAADDSALLQMSTYDHAAASQSSLPEDTESRTSGAFGPPEAGGPTGVATRETIVGKAKPLEHRPARHGAMVVHPRGRTVPVTKSALLNAVRAS